MNVLNIFKKKQSVNELIDEIHESFYTEVDKLLEQAKIPVVDQSNLTVMSKANKLTELGFSQTADHKKAAIEKEKHEIACKEAEERNRLHAAINYFSAKYPMYKFITEESVNKICNKYNLVYASVDRYTGNVPDCNLQHMINFKISHADKCVERIDTSWRSERLINYYNPSECYYRKEVLPLEIVAPKKDFNLKGLKSHGNTFFKPTPPDPVVLQPVCFKNRKFYLIVTAWGKEASDELVVNEKMN